MQSRKYKAVLETIQAGHGLTKTITVEYDSDRCLDYLLTQLADTSSNRPVKALKQHYRHRIYDPRADTWRYREVETIKRGADKVDAYHTKKTSTSYLPPDGITKFYQPKNGHPVILVFDGRQCHLKNEKYMFTSDAGTDLRWWLKNPHGYATHRSIGYAGVKNFIDTQRAAHIIPEPSELLVGLSKLSLQAILVDKDITAYRLRAMYTQRKIRETLRIDIPIIIVTSHGLKEYSELEQHNDLTLAVKFPYAYVTPTFIEKLFSKFPDQLQTDIRTSVHGFDNSAHEEELATIFADLPPVLLTLTLEYLPLLQLARIYYLMLQDPISSAAMLQKVKSAIQNVSLYELKDMVTQSTMRDSFEAADWENLNTAPMLQKYREFFRSLMKTNNDWKTVRIFLIFLFNVVNSENDNFVIKQGLAMVFQLPLTWSTLKDFIPEKNITLTDAHHANFIATVISQYDVALLKWLLKELAVFPTMTLMVHYNIEHDDSGRPQRWSSRDMIVSPVLVAALYCRFDTTFYLIENNPREYTQAIQQLKTVLSSKGERFGAYFDSEHMQKTLMMLNCLNPAKPVRSWSADEKILCRNALLDNLKALNSPAAVHDFWNKYKDANYLNARRHRFFDRVFRDRNHVCTTKQVVQDAVVKRINYLNRITSR